MHETPIHLTFALLRNGNLGISPAYGSFLAEAASCCLRYHNHEDPTLVSITGDVMTKCNLTRSPESEHEDSTWADLYEATEYGAYGVGIVVALRLTEKSYVERAVRGTGVDYWISERTTRDGPFQHSARLEVSGILKADEVGMTTRLRTKLSQTVRSDYSGLPAYVVIVDFGRPEARFVRSRT